MIRDTVAGKKFGQMTRRVMKRFERTQQWRRGVTGSLYFLQSFKVKDKEVLQEDTKKPFSIASFHCCCIGQGRYADMCKVKEF